MSIRTAAWMAWSVWTLCVVLFASPVLLEFFNSSVPTRGGPISNLYIAVALLAYPTVGAIVASRHPKNLVGWILCAIVLLFGVEAVAEVYPYYALTAGSEWLPGGVYMAWFSAKSLWLLGLFLGSAQLVLLFPNGRLLSRSWRAVVWLAVGGSAITAFAHATSPGRISPYRISNPFGIERNPRSILAHVSLWLRTDSASKGEGSGVKS